MFLKNPLGRCWQLPGRAHYSLASCQPTPKSSVSHTISKTKKDYKMTKILIARILFNAAVMYLLGRWNMISVTQPWHLFDPYQFKNIDAIITLGTVGIIFYSTALLGKVFAVKYSWIFWIPTVGSGIISFMILFWLDPGLITFPLSNPWFWMVICGLLIWGANEVFSLFIGIAANPNQTNPEKEPKAI